MGTAYLIALILGGGFILLSLVLGEVGAHVDVHVDGDAGVHVDSDVHAESGWGRLFSMRAIVYFLFGFGLGGYLTTWAGWGLLASLLVALPSGVLLMMLVSSLMTYLHRTEMVSIVGDETMAGNNARILVPPVGSSPGRVRVEVDGRSESLLAYLADPGAPSPQPGESVLIVEVRKGRLLVARI